ncbi:MAG: AAA family ATPase [Candidatus Paceibacterota bacterium]|jgi:chromosome segregation protein
MLKSLEISGFKSFAKKTELHFKSRVTAIVGPNGSGKSNVAEAFRFALGEQSIKSMRGKRGEDLIWNGSSEIGRSNRANVKLVFDNSKNLFQNFGGGMDFEEIIIERVVNRDGGNEYYLNGSLVRLKDIIELLAEAHIGASGHHIISQGEADRILSANMKERKEMIEDALGLKIYQYKREESGRKLLKTEENIKQVESLRREIAPHIKFLKKQVEKVEKAEELRLKLVKFYREYLKIEQIYLETQRKEIETEQSPVKEKLEKLGKEMEAAKNILATSAQKDQKSEELIDIENKIKKEREEKDQLYREVGKIEGEISANQRSIEKIKLDQKSEESKTILLREVEDLEREISTYSEVIKIIERVKNFIASHKTNFENKNLDELISLNDKLENSKKEVEERIKNIELVLTELNSEYQRIKNSIEKEKDSSREAEKNIFKISAEQSEARNKMELLKEKEHRLSIEENDWKREIAEGGVLLGTAILGFENDILDTTSPHTPLLAKERGEEERDRQLERRKELEKMKIRLEELGGGGGAEVSKEYRETVERDEFLQKELEDLKRSAESLEILIKELLEKLDIEFKQGVEKINNTFHEYFALMFGGGEAKLEVIKEPTRLRHNKNDSDDELDDSIGNSILAMNEKGYGEAREGIEISVSLPRKRTKGLDMLSGGERALTSIALLFAISQVNPPPFIILDETDAALDEANSKKYGDMIESLSKVSQLILITHNRETMSRAGVIYGVTMGHDSVSRLLSIEFDEAVAVAK